MIITRTREEAIRDLICCEQNGCLEKDARELSNSVIEYLLNHTYEIKGQTVEIVEEEDNDY